MSATNAAPRSGRKKKQRPRWRQPSRPFLFAAPTAHCKFPSCPNAGISDGARDRAIERLMAAARKSSRYGPPAFEAAASLKIGLVKGKIR
jgi:hypothetical protein